MVTNEKVREEVDRILEEREEKKRLQKESERKNSLFVFVHLFVPGILFIMTGVVSSWLGPVEGGFLGLASFTGWLFLVGSVVLS